MSVVNEFKAKAVRISSDPKQVWIIDPQGNRYLFPFDIYCHVRPMATKFNFFFDFKTAKLLCVYQDLSTKEYQCGVMKFWVEKDTPVPSAHWLSNMHSLMVLIQEQFAEQLADHTIDQIINSSESESV